MASMKESWKFDVFLSFRGEDTRKSFTDHLYSALEKKGIHTFRDDDKLKRGNSIAPELLKAIEESRFAVVVFSPNYAFSKWCLEEVSKITDCRHEMGQIVFPVFYHVDPSHVRKQRGLFGEAFAKHDDESLKDHSFEKVKKWRTSLFEIANLSGWDLKERPESEVIDEIVKEIFTLLNSSSLSSCVSDGELVGMSSRMEKLLSCLDTEAFDVRAIGIWGMGGIGKTTLAQEAFRKIKHKFDASCFIDNVREESERHGLRHLQEKLYYFLLESEAKVEFVRTGVHVLRDRLRCKKVLIVLDDVDKLDQIEALAGKGDFGGKGSRIIVTTRDKQWLKRFGENNVYVYEIDKLSKEESLRLFCKKAFKNNHPANEFIEKTNKVVKYADGLPLALQVLGSFLFERSEEEWSSALERLGKYPENDIFGPLKVSFDGLKHSEKKMFLDIACFFKGESEIRVKKILECSECYPGIDLKVLTEKSMVTIVGDKIWMHDLLQELAKQIVSEESPQEPGKRSRLFLHRDVHEILDKNSGTKAVEGIFFVSPKQEEILLNDDPFLKMCKLRLLKISNVKISGYLGYLSHELRLLEWHRYPLTSMPSSFKPENLVELNMSNSCIKELWNQNMVLEKLTLINLSNCHNLTKTPNFNTTPNLEKLILAGCKKLSMIHSSIGFLKRLVLLNLKDCESIKTLINEMSLESLKTLILSGCSRLNKFPEIVGKNNMKELTQLHLNGTAITELPDSIKFLSGLTLLNLKDCKKLESLPHNICSSLINLTTLNISGCSCLDHLPENLGSLECLEELYASKTAIRQVPSSITQLKSLKQLSFRGCSDIIMSGNKLWFSLICSCLFHVTTTKQEGSESVGGLMIPNSFSGLVSLKSLDLSKCNLQEEDIPDDFWELRSLELLDLSENNFKSLPSKMFELSKLRELRLNGCDNLQSLPIVSPSVKYVNARDCTQLKDLDGTIVWTTSNGFCVEDFRKSKLGTEGKEYRVGVSREHFYPLLHTSCEDDIYRGEAFGNVLSQATIPYWCSYSSSESFVTIQLPPDLNNHIMSTWMGLALCIVFQVQEKQENNTNNSTRYSCHFTTEEDFIEIPLGIFNVKEHNNSCVCKYIPRESFEGLLDKASHVVASIKLINSTTNCVSVKMCGAQLIYEKNVKEFVRDLYPMPNDVQSYVTHCQELVDDVTKNPSVGEIESMTRERTMIDKIESVVKQVSGEEITNLNESSSHCEAEQQLATSSNRFCFEAENETSFIAFETFSEMLSKNGGGCGGYVSALFAISDNQFEIEICGIRKVYENDVENFVQTIIDCTMQSPRVHHEIYCQIFEDMEKKVFHEEEKAFDLGYYYSVLPRKNILDWFKHQTHESKLRMQIPQNLYDDENWRGVMVCAAFSVIEHPGTTVFDTIHSVPFKDFHLVCDFNLGEENTCLRVKPVRYKKDIFKWLVLRSFIWLVYIPHTAFTKSLNEVRYVEAKMHSFDCHGLAVQRCGMRLLYQHEVKEFKQEIVKCVSSFFDDLDPILLHMRDEKMKKSPDFNSIAQWNQRTDVELLIVDFHQNTIFNSCFTSTEILEWFRNYAIGPSVKLELPTSTTLLSDENWLGLALCAYFTDLDPQHPNIGECSSPHHLICQLQTDRGNLEHPHVHRTTNEEFRYLDHEGRFIWLSYIPRGWFSDEQQQLNDCSVIEASFASDSGRSLRVEKCGLCLLFRHQEDEFKRTIAHCMKSSSQNEDLVCSMPHNGCEASTSSCSSTTKVDSHPKRSETPNPTSVKGKEKLVSE
uniref:ADP-ribosyl cyclase/cyclic ADP-ribose hydrolase n=1 Tax=Cannabis sativa TaxID=3483 RepID=A0A803Q3N9_CANSA